MNEERSISLLLLAEQADSASRGPDESRWLDRVEAEHEQLLVALQWFHENGDAEKALRLSTALYSFWHSRGHTKEGLEWLQKVLAAPGGSVAIRAKALHRAGMLAFRSGDEAAARSLFTEGLEKAREIGDKWQIAATALGLGRLVGLRLGDYHVGRVLFTESLEIARELGDKQSQAGAVHCLAALARLEGDQTQAVELYKESMALRRELGDAGGVAIEQLNLGFLTFHKGDLQTAARMFSDSLQYSYEHGDQYVMPPNFVGLAGLALKSRDPIRAARLLGVAEGLLQQAGLVFDPDDQMEYDRIASSVRAELGDVAMNAQGTEGRAMTAEQAIQDARKITTEHVARRA